MEQRTDIKLNYWHNYECNNPVCEHSWKVKHKYEPDGTGLPCEECGDGDTDAWINIYNLGEYSYEEFLEVFKPIQNKLSKNANFNNTLFSKSGMENVMVKATLKSYPTKIWSVTTEEGGDSIVVVPGYKHIDTLGYLITQYPRLSDAIADKPIGHE